MKVARYSERINRIFAVFRSSVMLPTLMVLLAVFGRSHQVHGIMFPEDASEETGTCLRTGSPLLPCVVSGAVSWTEGIKGRDLQLAEDLVLIPEDAEDLPVTGDPREAQTLLDAVDKALSSRRLSWNMSWLYPGLSMVVSRAPDPRLYFAVDRRAVVQDRRETTGRLIVKRTVLPILLGVKLKLASLVPILVGVLVLLAKKALLVSKLSLLLSGLTLFRGSAGSSLGGNRPVYETGGVYGQPVRGDDGWLTGDDSERHSNVSFF